MPPDPFRPTDTKSNEIETEPKSHLGHPEIETDPTKSETELNNKLELFVC